MATCAWLAPSVWPCQFGGVMTLFVVFGLVAVVIGVLVAVALGVRSMRAGERTDDDDWDSRGADSELADADDFGGPTRRRSDRKRQGARRASGRAHPDDYDRPRGYRGRGTRAVGSTGSNPDYGTDPGIGTDRGSGTDRDFADPGFATDPGFGREYQHANGRAELAGHGAEQGYGGDGYQRRPTPAAGPGGELQQLRDHESKLGTATNVARSVSRPRTDNIKDSRQPARAGRRHMQQKEQPKKRARPPRGRGGNGEGWNDTNWESVSDEDYWAELSSDKPLASRTAQSAADLRSPEPEQKKLWETRSEPKLTQSEPQTATMAMPEFSAARLPGADLADLAVPALPVRRSGSTTGPMPAVPAAARPTAHAAADYADPNLALLASLGEPAGEGRARRAAGNGRGPAPAEQPGTPPGGWPAPAERAATPPGGWPAPAERAATPPGGWPAPAEQPGTPPGGWPAPAERAATPPGGWPAPAEQPGTPPGGWGAVRAPGQRDWSQPGQEYGSAAGPPGGYHSAPPEVYSVPSNGTFRQASGHASGTPGHGILASPAYAPDSLYDTGPGTPVVAQAPAPPPAPALAPAPYGAAHSTGADEVAGQLGGPVEMTGTQGSGYSGSHAVRSYDSASYGNPSQPGASYGGTSYSSGSYGSTSHGGAASYGSASHGSASHPADSRTTSARSTGSYGAATANHAAPDTGWAPQDATNGRHAEGSWQHRGQAGIGGPASATPINGYASPLASGHPGGLPAGVPGTPAGGFPIVQDAGPTDGYGSQPQAGGSASGYLSRSALSGQHGVSEPELLASPYSGNPYGSYVTGQVNPGGEGPNGDTGRQPRHRDPNGYDGQRPYGGYGDYNSGSRG